MLVSSDEPRMVRVRVNVDRRRRRRRRLVLGGVLLLIVLGGVALALLARPLVSARTEAKAAQADLTAAKASLGDGRFAQARAQIRSARGHVAAAQDDVSGTGGDVWAVIPVAGRAVKDERHLVDALDETTSVAEIGARIYPVVSGKDASLVRGQRIDVKALAAVVARTGTIGPHLDRAVAELDQVSGSTPIVGAKIEDAKATAMSYLLPLQASYRKNEPLLRSLPSIVGADGARTYLLAMLNPAEQRYSGGGALSFTTMRFDHGAASFGTSVNVDDILAKGDQQSWTPVPGNIFHRKPPLRVTSSTFSPWWQVSSEELLRGYSKAFPGTRYDGVVGVDLQALASLFAITGPVDLPSFGAISSDNLVKTLAGSYGNFDSVAQRHQLNEQLVPAFRQKFFEGGQMKKKVESLVTSAKGRHFFLYFRDPRIQQGFARAGLSGNLSTTPNDYIGVFTQNLNGSKVDYWQHREVQSTVKLNADGSARVHLHITVTNGAPPYTLPVPDPGVGYTTRRLGARIAVFAPQHAFFRSTSINGHRFAFIRHEPKVAGVVNRRFIENTMRLDAGQSNTLDVTYKVKNAAEVASASSMTYSLTADPQDLVTPQTLRVTVLWPSGFAPTGALPAGWRATSTGATYSGPLAEQTQWRIPLAAQ
jgi:hypothetical protein